MKARKELKYGKSIYDMNLRVVYYARVSTDSEEQLNSLENQQNFFEDYIENSKSWIFVGNYIDEGISGTSIKNRTNFLKMIADAEKGKFDMIITKEVSRFARNTVDSIQYTNHLLEHGVIVNFLNDNLNTIDESCEFRLTIMSSLAQDEVRKLSSRVKFGLERSVKDGKVLGGGNITGYNKKNGRLYINEDEAPMIRMLFSLYASGEYGFRTIADKLYNAGFKNDKGMPYADRVLSRMIRNPKYKGFYCGNISYVSDYKTHKKVMRPQEEWIIYKDDKIPAIVSEEIWDRANLIYDSKRDIYNKQVGKRNYYNDRLYTGKLVCTEHGCNFTRIASGKRKNNPVWQCQEYTRGGLKRCETPTLFEKHLNEIFKKLIDEFSFNRKEIFQTILDDYSLFLKEDNEDFEIDNLKQRKEKINKYKKKLLELSLDGSLLNAEFKEKNDEYNKELRIINNKILEFENKKASAEEYIEKLKVFEKKLTEKLSSESNFKELFNLLVDKVYVSKINGDRKNIKLEVIFNYDYGSKAIIQNFNKNSKKSKEIFFDSESLLTDTKRPRC